MLVWAAARGFSRESVRYTVSHRHTTVATSPHVSRCGECGQTPGAGGVGQPALVASRRGLARGVGHRATQAAKPDVLAGLLDTSRLCYLTDCGEGVGSWAARTPWDRSHLRSCDASSTRDLPHKTGDAKCAGDRASSRSLWAVVCRCSQVAVSFTTLPFSVLTARGVRRDGRGTSTATHPHRGRHHDTQPVTASLGVTPFLAIDCQQTAVSLKYDAANGGRGRNLENFHGRAASQARQPPLS
ncbi:hypothetical protein E2C01_006490 [Portunus trituberculatus]|uniref:Uncharacterized protein n=1 Tax=Portunus trituberculatus TaxID=210409 RepID=A0A5B7CXH5_PORTR|nr:hypothetical protein [Portunus trituberculatus]